MLDERRDRIIRDLDAAERLKGETEKALAGYEQALADAKSNAGSIAKEAQAKLNADIERERGDVEAKITGKITEAETRIAAMKTKALARSTTSPETPPAPSSRSWAAARSRRTRSARR